MNVWSEDILMKFDMDEMANNISYLYASLYSQINPINHLVVVQPFLDLVLWDVAKRG